jgi:isopentenyl-diphosphate delta-isomerase
MHRNQVVLVDTEDNVIGVMDKMEAHLKGHLHRAFSIFIFNSKGEMLLQQRAAGKYHGGSLWTNACCSHPLPGEEIVSAAHERLIFEMGLECELSKIFSFIYHAKVENELIEHEYDHILVGITDQVPNFNPDEVQDYRWVSISDLEMEIQQNPDRFTVWFRKIMDQYISALVGYNISK